MSANGLNSFLLITLGAGFFALSINKGRSGAIRESILFACLAVAIGLTKAADDGIFDDGPITIIAVVSVYFLLPVLGVIVARQVFERPKVQEKKLAIQTMTLIEIRLNKKPPAQRWFFSGSCGLVYLRLCAATSSARNTGASLSSTPFTYLWPSIPPNDLVSSTASLMTTR